MTTWTQAQELANRARNLADTANDHAGEAKPEDYAAACALTAIAYGLLAAVEQLAEIAEAQRETASLLRHAQVMA